jgi:hypothetical protein
MSLAYRLMYLVGFTPWDRDEIPEVLSTLVDGADASPGRTLDLAAARGRKPSISSPRLAGDRRRNVDRALRRARGPDRPAPVPSVPAE